MEVSENFPLPTQEVERNREDGTDQETPQEAVVHCTSTEHPLGSKGTPEDGSGKVIVDSWTSEMILLVNRANIGNLRHLVVENGGADESGNEGGEHLAVEGYPRWNVDVMGKFHILCEVEGVRGCDISIGFEVEYRSSVTGEPESAEHFGKNVEENLNVGDSHDDAAGNAEDNGEEDTVQHDTGGSVGRVGGDTSCTKGDGNAQNEEVDPLRNLSVRPHQSGVDVFGVGGGRFATDQILEASEDLVAMVQGSVSNDGSVGCEVNAIDCGVTGRQTGTASTESDGEYGEGYILGGRIGLIGSLVE